MLILTISHAIKAISTAKKTETFFQFLKFLLEKQAKETILVLIEKKSLIKRLKMFQILPKNLFWLGKKKVFQIPSIFVGKKSRNAIISPLSNN